MSLENLINHKPTLGLGKLFDDAQRHKNEHPAIISSMFKISRKANLTVFTMEFLQSLTCALVQKERSPYAFVALDFAAKFCCHHSKHVPEDEEDVFFATVINYVTKVSDGKVITVRLRVCKFISQVLANMSVEATIDVDIFEIITQCMLDRAKDKMSSVRVHSFTALQRVQDPQNPDCPVTKAFIYHLECDPSTEVRRHILKNIAITQYSLPAIICRSRDNSELVRKETYQTLAKIKPKRLRIRQRQEILTNGFNDTSEVVKVSFVKKLIPTWFENCERDYLKLLELVFVESFSLETVTNLLYSLFERRASTELLDLVKSWQNLDRVVPIDELTTEKALFWLTVVKYFNNPPSGVKVESQDVVQILPTLTYFANYLKEFRKKLTASGTSPEQTYIMLRLLDLLYNFTLTDDENGREEVKQLVGEMLLSNEIENQELVKTISKLLSFLIPEVQDRLDLVVSIISDIQHPLEDQPDNAISVVAESSVIQDSLMEMPSCIESLRINSDGQTKETQLDFYNVKMLPKCLLILIEVLKSKDVNTLLPVLDTLQKNFLANCLQMSDSYILSLGVSALSLLCLICPNLAMGNFIKFVYMMESDFLQLSCLEAVFDQVVAYGFDLFHLDIDKTMNKGDDKTKRSHTLDFDDDPTINRASIKHLLNRLSSSLFSQVIPVRSVTCQGFAKLLLAGRIKSSFALAKLVILWFSPQLGSDPTISQPLGIFFDLYAKKIPDAGEVILNSLIPALDYVTSNYCDTALDNVDPIGVSNLLLDALKKVQPPEEGPSYHCQAANLICDEILIRGVTSEVKLCVALTKSLLHLELRKADKEFAQDLMDNLPFVLAKVEKLKEKSVKRIATNFTAKLQALWGLRKSQINPLSKKDCNGQDSTNSSTRRNGSSQFQLSEPIIEEFSGSEEEDNALSRNSCAGNAVVPGTPDSECAAEDSSEPDEITSSPPLTRKQRKLVF